MSQEKEIFELTEVTVRFAGDSGDGMQLTGSQFSDTTALFGNDLNTLPDYPAEIRAPAGTTYGVSGFQLHFSSQESYTPGDHPDVLVAMNPAALKVNLKDLKPGATIIINSDSFDSKNLQLSGYKENPLENDSLSNYRTYVVPITNLTSNALKDTSLGLKEVIRCKNFFALGLMYWLFSRELNATLDWIREKFAKKPEIARANELALKAGYNYGEHNEIFTTRYEIKPAQLPKGVYRNVAGNEATAMGFVAASLLSDLPLFLGSYPITPASEIMQYLSTYKNYGVKTLQAEDEIAGIASAIGASYGGNLAITTTSGPGLALKTEAMGLAVMTELPLVIVDVQRGGPSTGLPTKTEQADLLQAIFGRNGESPIPVIAAYSPSDCFYTAIEACRIALKYMTPVLMLTDGYIANGAEPWKLPEIEELPKIEVKHRTEVEGFMPYLRDENLARPWAVPGTPGLEHRIGGLEKANITGTVSYDSDNHDLMCKLRDKKVKGIQKDIPDAEIRGDKDADILVLGWGGTFGAISEAVRRVRTSGLKVAQVHLKHINPFPANLGEVLNRYKHILIPEINLGQLVKVIKSEYSVKVNQFNLMRGLPLKAHDIENKIREILGGENGK